MNPGHGSGNIVSGCEEIFSSATENEGSASALKVKSQIRSWIKQLCNVLTSQSKKQLGSRHWDELFSNVSSLFEGKTGVFLLYGQKVRSSLLRKNKINTLEKNKNALWSQQVTTPEIHLRHCRVVYIELFYSHEGFYWNVEVSILY